MFYVFICLYVMFKLELVFTLALTDNFCFQTCKYIYDFKFSLVKLSSAFQRCLEVPVEWTGIK